MDLTEAQTRVQLIDRHLALAGWHVRDRAQVIEELEIHLRADQTAYPKASYAEGDSRFSDYGLLLNGDPAAVIEAKRTSRDAELGKEKHLEGAGTGSCTRFRSLVQRAFRGELVASSRGQP